MLTSLPRPPAKLRAPERTRATSYALNIPNMLSLMRAVLVPVVFWLLLSGSFELAFFLFLLAGITDAVDGWIAKRFNMQTELGAYLDPLADKLLVVCIFVALGSLGELPSWLVVAVVSRDVLIIVAVVLSWMLNRPVAIRPYIVSKANTAAQITLAALVLADLAFSLGFHTLRLAVAVLTGLLTCASLAAYMRAWLRHMAGYESGRPGV
jgi:cardiolipin synthase